MFIFWGILMIAIGLFMFVCGLMKSEFIIYKILVTRSKMLWGKHVHQFYQITGIAIIIVGIFMATGIFEK